MKEIIIDTVLDGLKLFPFLFLAFLVIEFFEHKFNKKTKKIISNSKKYGPFLGSFFGLFPSCGFSVLATNLYVTKIISLGTLISIYLTTSDEMLPILIASKISYVTILKILGIKFIVGIIFGIIIDLLYRKKSDNDVSYEICDHEHCHCEKNNVFVSALIHSLKTIAFVLIITFIVNYLFAKVEINSLSKIFLKNNVLSLFFSSLIGLIPSCGASVMLSELYIKGIINFATMISGLLTGSGVAILVLFKTHKNIKEKISIVSLVYLIGVIVGLVLWFI